MAKLFFIVFLAIAAFFQYVSSQSFVLRSNLVPAKQGTEHLRNRSRRQASNQHPTITELHIVSRIVTRFATTNIISKLKNEDEVDVEAQFIVQIPDSAFISNFSMVINNEEYFSAVRN